MNAPNSSVVTLEAALRFRFHDKRLEALYTEEKGAKRYPAAVVDSFFEVMTTIQAATSTQDLRQLKSLHMERLQGKRAGQYSLRLNSQFRLVFKIEKKGDEELLIIEIVDYHR